MAWGRRSRRQPTLSQSQVNAAYRKILGRNVDPAGIKAHVGNKDVRSVSQMESILRNSREYAQQQARRNAPKPKPKPAPKPAPAPAARPAAAPKPKPKPKPPPRYGYRGRDVSSRGSSSARVASDERRARMEEARLRRFTRSKV